MLRVNVESFERNYKENFDEKLRFRFDASSFVSNAEEKYSSMLYNRIMR